MIRTILFGNDGSVTSIPFGPFEKALDGDLTILFPDFAGQTVKAAIIFVNTKDQMPASIRRIEPILLKFNSDGQVDRCDEKEELDLVGEILAGFTKQGSDDVLERLKPDLDALRYRDKYKWSPTPTHLTAINELALH